MVDESSNHELHPVTQKDQIPSNETLLKSRRPAYQVIFDGVYDQIKQDAARFTSEDKAADWFLREVSGKVPHHMDEIEAKSLKAEDIYKEIWHRMANYISHHPENPNAYNDASERYNGLVNHLEKLVQAGEVDPFTAKVFARNLHYYKNIGFLFYQPITRNNSVDVNAILPKIPAYETAVHSLIQGYKPHDVRRTTEFVQFNDRKLHGQQTSRIYISPNPIASPNQVVYAWEKALESSGIKDTLCYKISDWPAPRYEGIVVYPTDQTPPEGLEKLLTAFRSGCSPEFLSSQPMPSTVSLARGISMGPELNNINSFIRSSGVDEQVSYNNWVASTTHLAFELAYHELSKQGVAQLTPLKLREPAVKYFKQLTILSGLNPNTMIQNSLGGELPMWAQRLQVEEAA